MAKKKTAANSTAKKKVTKKTVKKNTTKTSTKKVVVKEEKKVDDITEALAEGVVSDSSTKEETDAQVATSPTKDYYDISLEQINMYKETHNGEDPGLDLEEVKKDANDGFATIILDNDSADIPDDVKATINFAEQVMSQAEAE